jgi:hypothetical protein
MINTYIPRNSPDNKIFDGCFIFGAELDQIFHLYISPLKKGKKKYIINLSPLSTGNKHEVERVDAHQNKANDICGASRVDGYTTMSFAQY